MGWDGMGWDGMGWDGMGWDGMGRTSLPRHPMASGDPGVLPALTLMSLCLLPNHCSLLLATK